MKTLQFDISDRKPKDGMLMRLIEHKGGIEVQMAVDMQIQWEDTPRILTKLGLWLIRSELWFRKQRAKALRQGGER